MPQPYGTIYNKNLWKDTNDFSPNGATCIASGGKIFISLDSATSTVDFKYYSLLERWQASAKFRVLSVSASAGLGTRSINQYQTFSVYASIDFTDGHLQIFSTNHVIGTNSNTITAVATSNTNISIKKGEHVVVSIERKTDTVLAAAWVSSRPNIMATAKYAYLTNDYSIPSPNTGTFSLYANRGSFILDSLNITSQELKNSNILILTDSKGMYVADNFKSRWPQQVANLKSPAILSIGGTDGVNELLARVPEITALAPRKVLVAIGRNDLVFGMSFDSLKAKYDRAVTRLNESGIEVYHLNGIYETQFGQNQFSRWIGKTYGQNVIDTYSPTSKGQNLLYKDGVHPNQSGNNVIANTIIKSGKI